MRAPEFWSAGGIAPALLAPLSLLFRAGGALRELGVTAWRAPVPVICVGNLTVGGAGKTPTVIALAALLKRRGLDVACVSRGYGGNLPGPLQVDPARHKAAEVGDEPLLLARDAAAWVARDRRDGVRAAIAEGADVVILDDGLQYPALAPRLSFIVIDGPYGFGNGRVLPAGPLREPVEAGLTRAGAAIVIGEDTHGLAARLSGRLQVLRARLEPDADSARFKDRRVYAFAGIGRPGKFFATLRELGAVIAGEAAFPDHHRYSEDETMKLVEAAQRADAEPVTTEKDFTRLPDGARRMVKTIGVRLRFDDPAALEAVLLPALAPRPESEHAHG